MIPDPEAFPVFEEDPYAVKCRGVLNARGITTQDMDDLEVMFLIESGRWVSLSRARLGPEEPSSSP